MGSEFRIFGGFGWVHSSILVDIPGFGRVQSLIEHVQCSGFLEGFERVRNLVLVIFYFKLYICMMHKT